VLYPAELRARPLGKSSYCKGNSASTGPAEIPFRTPKKRVVCTGFALHPDSDGFPIVMLQGFPLARSDDIFTGDGASKMEDNTPNGLSAVLQLGSTC
jgi:hypothetical protein